MVFGQTLYKFNGFLTTNFLNFKYEFSCHKDCATRWVIEIIIEVKHKSYNNDTAK